MNQYDAVAGYFTRLFGRPYPYASAEFGGSAVWQIKSSSRGDKYTGWFLVFEEDIVIIKRTADDEEGTYDDTLVAEMDHRKSFGNAVKEIAQKAMRIARK